MKVKVKVQGQMKVQMKVKVQVKIKVQTGCMLGQSAPLQLSWVFHSQPSTTNLR